MKALLVAVGIGVLVGGSFVAAWVHHGYAWRNYRAAVRAVPPARRTWLERLGTLLGWCALVAIACGILYLLSTGPQR